MSHPVALAAVGWKREDWILEFYPGDLPEDWTLNYYANEFSHVMVPASYWQEEPDTQEWPELAEQGLHFYFQVGAQVLPQCIAMAELLGDGLSGFLVQNRGIDCMTIINQLGDTVRGRDVFSVEPCDDCSACWVPGSQGSGYGAGILQLEHEAEPRELRGYIEKYIQATDADSPVIFVDAPPAVIRTLRTLLDLMGL